MAKDRVAELKVQLSHKRKYDLKNTHQSEKMGVEKAHLGTNKLVNIIQMNLINLMNFGIEKCKNLIMKQCEQKVNFCKSNKKDLREESKSYKTNKAIIEKEEMLIGRQQEIIK